MREIIVAELDKAIALAEHFKGGMEEYKNTLEDSDLFYNEAAALGAVDALKDLLKLWDQCEEGFKIKSEADLIKFVDLNSYLLVDDVLGMLKKALPSDSKISKESEQTLTRNDGTPFNEEIYHLKLNNAWYSLQIEDKSSIDLLLQGYVGLGSIFYKENESRYSFVNIADKKVKVNLPLEIYEEYYNEINCDIQYNSNDDYKGKGSIIIEDDRYGFGLGKFVVNYNWQLEETKIICIIEKEFDKTENVINDGYVFSRMAASYIKLTEDGKSVICCESDDNKQPLIDKVKYMTHLPKGLEVHCLNEINALLGANLIVFDFKNVVSEFEKKTVLNFQEGENDDTVGASYLISNLVADWQVKLAIDVSNYVWNSIDDENKSFEEIAKDIEKLYKVDLYEILDEVIPSEWYQILESVFLYLNIEFTHVDMKRIVI